MRQYIPIESNAGAVAYRRHNGLSISTLHITKRHLSALMLVDLDFRIVVVWYLLQGDWHGSVRLTRQDGTLQFNRNLTLFLRGHAGYSHCSIRGHLLGT